MENSSETFNIAICEKVATKTSYRALRKQWKNEKHKKITLVILLNVFICIKIVVLQSREHSFLGHKENTRKKSFARNFIFLHAPRMSNIVEYLLILLYCL